MRTGGLLIEQGRTTLASMLKNQGYATAVVGKWHLGLGDKKPDWNGELKPGPLEVGFDYYFGYYQLSTWEAMRDGLSQPVFVENHRIVGLNPLDPITDVESNNLKGGTAARISLDQVDGRHAEKAVAWIESVPRTTPLFLYFATHTIHEPCKPPNPHFKDTSECGPRGDCIQEHDWRVGQILDALDRTGRSANTLVIYSSDNGGVPPYVKGKGGILEPSALREGDHRPNGDLRGTKWNIWEGGHRVPLIVRWPGRTPAGTESNELVCLTDVLALCAELVGAPLPNDAGEDSFSFLPVILGKQRALPRGPLIMHDLGGAFAVREGSWKLIPGQRLLFDLAHDLGETKNLYAEKPEIVSKLTAQLERIKQDGHSRP